MEINTPAFHIKTRDEFTPAELKRFEHIFLKLPKRSAHFDRFGLRFPAAALNGLGLRIIFFPIEVMADFVDANTKRRCDAGENMPVPAFSQIKKAYAIINATMIGNLAYVAINCSYPQSKTKCLLLLEDIYKIESEKRNR